MTIPAWLSALQRPDAFDHPTTAFTLCETHISWVLLTGPFAYKFKKPVDFGFLDYTTLEKRQFYCAEELRLNKRLAPVLYDAVVPLQGSLERPVVGKPGTEGFEYAVRMHQFAAEDRLDAVLERAELTMADIDALAGRIASYHQAAPRVALAGSLGTAALVQQAISDNFTTITATGRLDPAWRETFEAVAAWSIEQGSRLAGLIDERRRHGMVRELHGDMHLSNMARFRGEVVIFDGIEFSETLRWIDCMSEIAFLFMDLTVRGAPGFAWRVLSRYLEASGDYAGLAVFWYFACYRAMVRAKIAALSDDEGSQARLGQYLHLAAQFTQARRPFLLLLHGLSGCGKSHLAAQLIAELQVLQVRSDIERKRLAGIDPLQRGADALYSETMNRRTYEHLAQIAQIALQSGCSLCLDAAFLRSADRRQAAAPAERLGAPWLILSLSAPQEVLRARLAARQGDPSDADLHVLDLQLASAEPLSALEQAHTLAIETTKEEPLPELVERIRERLGIPCRP